jgi:hypothetical protein
MLEKSRRCCKKTETGRSLKQLNVIEAEMKFFNPVARSAEDVEPVRSRQGAAS